MNYLDRLAAEMDPELKARILGGEYIKLLEGSLVPIGHPLRELHFSQAVTAVARGEDCARIVSRFKELAGARVLDLGCGDGGLSAAFARAGAEVTGIDSDEWRVHRARALAHDLGLDIRFLVKTDFGESLPDASFDVIVTNDVIEHVDSFDRLARGQSRLLAPGGVLYFNPPNRFSLRLLRRDPHYRLVGVSLLGHRLGKFYVTTIRRRVQNYTVNRLLGYYEVHRIYRRAGIELQCISTETILDRLSRRQLPAAWQRAVAPLIPIGLAEPLIRLLILDQWIFIGRYSGNQD
jgi:2-polyprenyl-3-methyl-5-hydroxy-6-metoxy-1,4-benzoquinol methylase